MSISIPGTQAQAEDNLARFENRIQQSAPVEARAFLIVLAGMEAMQFTALYKYGAERVLQNLVKTATGDDLAFLANEYKVDAKTGEAAVLIYELPATDGTVISSTIEFIGDANGVRYYHTADVTATGGKATITGTAKVLGTDGNLEVGATLSIAVGVAGAESTATVTVVDTVGANPESDNAWRQRILDKIGSIQSGVNLATYRAWAEAVEGVARAFPYAGNPTYLETGVGETTPPERTIYVEADADIDAGGIAPQSLLDDVRDAIINDPITGETRQTLGLPDSALFVASVIRTPFYVEVRNLTVSPDAEAQVKASVETALNEYFDTIRPYIDGLDSLLNKNNIITDMIVTARVQDVLDGAGATATGVGFGITPGSFLAEYPLGVNQLAKLEDLTWA